MKFDPLILMIFPMLKVTALAGQSLMLRRVSGLQALGARIPIKLDWLGSHSSTRLFNSLSNDDTDGNAKEVTDDFDTKTFERTQKAEKTFKGLTRMRLKKALLKAPGAWLFFLIEITFYTSHSSFAFFLSYLCN